MPYDGILAGRIRELLEAEMGVEEKKMFGGLAFLIHGNMFVAASGQGGLLLRVDPEAPDPRANHAHVSAMVMRGRTLKGWLRVSPDGIRTKKQLAAWVKRGVAYARSLSPKR